MQKRPIIIAMAAAGIIAGGTTAGIAALNNSEIAPVPATPQISAAEVQAPAEMQTPAEPQAPVVIEAQAPAETAPVVTAQATEAARPAARSATDERMVRIPFTNRYVKISNPTFPSAGLESPDPLPGTLAWFESRRNTAVAGASGNVFPSAALETDATLPATVAHFERAEARRLAATRPAPVAAVVETPATAQPSVAAEVAPQPAQSQPTTQAMTGN